MSNEIFATIFMLIMSGLFLLWKKVDMAKIFFQFLSKLRDENCIQYFFILTLQFFAISTFASEEKDQYGDAEFILSNFSKTFFVGSGFASESALTGGCAHVYDQSFHLVNNGNSKDL